MSNFKLGIFNDLAGYLTAAYTECGDSVDRCDANKIYNSYYLQKYYKPKAHMARNEDVAPQFTNAVIKFAQKLATFDKSVGSSPTLKKLLREAAAAHLNARVVMETGGKIADLITNLKSDLLTSADTNGDDEFQNGVLKNVSDLTDALKNVINASSMFTDDKTNAVTCLTGTGGKKLDKLNSCDSLAAFLATARFKSSSALALKTDGTKTFVDNKTAAAAAKQDVVNQVLSVIDSWIAANYDTKGITVTGKETNVANALALLKDSKSLDATELKLFNAFFRVMKKNTSGDWDKCDPSEYDSSKPDDFRINADMNATLSPRVPSIVSLIPVVKAGTNVLYNDGNVGKTATDANTLREIFKSAYLDPKVPSLTTPAWDASSNSKLQPDLEALFAEIVLRKDTPNAHMDDDDTSEMAKVLSRWQRVGENVWKHTLDDGTVVTIKPGSPEFEEDIRKEVANCAAVGFSKDPVKCASFLESVALGSTDELAKVAADLDETVAPEVVRNLHPKFALAILKAFGFHRKMCKDRVAGRQIEKIQRASEWLEKYISKKFTNPKDVDLIKGKAKLIAFLDLLAQLVNANPSVLNDNMVTETEESRGEVVVPGELAARKIKPATAKGKGKPFLGWGEIQSNMNKVYGSFSRGLTFDGMSTNSPFGMDNLFPQMNMLTSAPIVRGSTWGGMVGGGPDVKVFLQDHQTALEYSSNVQRILDELLANLRTSGKTFSKEELDAINKKKAQFEEMERELFGIAWNIQKYSQLLKVVEAENRPETITREHIERYVEKYNGLLGRYEKSGNSFNTLISLLKDCAEDGEKGDCKTL